jgi:hypothetical protein
MSVPSSQMAKRGVVPSASHLTENVPGPARKDRYRLGNLPGAASDGTHGRTSEEFIRSAHVKRKSATTSTLYFDIPRTPTNTVYITVHT